MGNINNYTVITMTNDVTPFKIRIDFDATDSPVHTQVATTLDAQSTYTYYTKRFLELPLVSALFKDKQGFIKGIDTAQTNWDTINQQLEVLKQENEEEANTLHQWLNSLFEVIDAQSPLETAAEALLHNYRLYFVNSLDDRNISGQEQRTLAMLSQTYGENTASTVMLNSIRSNQHIIQTSLIDHLRMRETAADNVEKILGFYHAHRTQNQELIFDQTTDYLSAMIHPLISAHTNQYLNQKPNQENPNQELTSPAILRYWSLLDQIARSPISLLAIPHYARDVVNNTEQGLTFQEAIEKSASELVDNYKKHQAAQSTQGPNQTNPQPL